MSFTWNGLAVNKIIPIHAVYSVSESLLHSSTAVAYSNIEDEIKYKLALEISQQIVQLMDIDIENDSLSSKKTYHGKTHMAILNPKSNYPNSVYDTFSTSPFNGTSAITSGASITNTTNGKIKRLEEFRVCEYTHNGKVTRVELQRYEDGFWEKIPRVQIEE